MKTNVQKGLCYIKTHFFWINYRFFCFNPKETQWLTHNNNNNSILKDTWQHFRVNLSSWAMSWNKQMIFLEKYRENQYFSNAVCLESINNVSLQLYRAAVTSFQQQQQQSSCLVIASYLPLRRLMPKLNKGSDIKLFMIVSLKCCRAARF